jgi:hypothetical protein
MRILLMHHTSPHWEAGARPGPELVARVGALMGEMAGAGILRGGEGLRASSLGARLRAEGGRVTVTPGPFTGGNELPASFAILRVRSLDEATRWASRFAAVVGDAELDLRPLTEAWDLGLAPAPPGPERRFMLLRKADAASEAEQAPPPEQVSALSRLLGEMRRAGVLLVSVGLAPSARGARYRFQGSGHTAVDGPFAESKELLGGYVILELPSLAEARPWALRYGEVVGCPSLELRPLAEEPGEE